MLSGGLFLFSASCRSCSQEEGRLEKAAAGLQGAQHLFLQQQHGKKQTA
jgi:hypothetical protein